MGHGTKKKPYANQTRITNGKQLLPTVDGRTVWARLVKDTFEAMVEHCGGQDYISEPKRMASRRAAVLETELCFLEDRMARIRQEGGEPDAALLDLYGRLAGHQKRANECVGFERTQRDVSPTAARAELLATPIKREEAEDV